MGDPQKLLKVLRRVRNPLFAVVDGAQFPDLPSALSDEGLRHRSLYRDNGNADDDREQAAPRMIWLDRERDAVAGKDDLGADPGIVGRLVELVGERHACVFWECAAGGERLYRHLRTINVVLFPVEADVAPGKSYEMDPRIHSKRPTVAANRLRRVLLRHADPNVMAQIIPSLSQPQYLRLFGPANAIIYQPDEEWGGSITRASRSENTSSSPQRGPLSFDIVDIKEIERRRHDAVVQRRLIYLRKVAPDYTVSMSDDDLRALLLRQESEATELGLKREYSYKLWAFMMLIAGEESGRAPEVRTFIRSGPASPDENFDVLFTKTKSVVHVHRKAV